MTAWIDVGRTYGVFVEGEGQFEPLAGMLLDIIRTTREGSKEPKRILVGDVNPAGGECACCMGLEYDDFIIRYRMVDLEAA